MKINNFKKNLQRIVENMLFIDNLVINIVPNPEKLRQSYENNLLEAQDYQQKIDHLNSSFDTNLSNKIQYSIEMVIDNSLMEDSFNLTFKKLLTLRELFNTDDILLSGESELLVPVEGNMDTQNKLKLVFSNVDEANLILVIETSKQNKSNQKHTL